jgi:hypothetical protein
MGRMDGLECCDWFLFWVTEFSMLFTFLVTNILRKELMVCI